MANRHATDRKPLILSNESSVERGKSPYTLVAPANIKLDDS
jgi:hypothetical protein